MGIHFNGKHFLLIYVPLLLLIIAYSLPYDNLAYLAGGLLILIRVQQSNNRMNIILKKQLGYIFIYLIYTSFVTLINFGYLRTYWRIGLKNAVMMLYLFFLLNILFSKIDLEKFFDFVEKFYIVIGIMGIIEFIIRFPVWEYLLSFKVNTYVENAIYTSEYRCVNLFAHPIMYGVYLGVGIIFMAFRLRYNLKRFIVCEVILIVDLISTQSRSAMFALAAVGGFLVLKKFFMSLFTQKIKGRIRRILIGFVVVGILTVVLTGSGQIDVVHNLLFRFRHMLDAGQAGGQIIRIEVARSIFHYIPEHFETIIFGNGFYAGQAYLEEHPIFKGTWKWKAGIDNQFITLFFESGIIGIVLIFIPMIKELIYLKRHRNSLCSQVMLVQIFFIAVSFFYESLEFMSTYILFIILLLLFEIAKNKDMQGVRKSEIHGD